VWNRFRIQRAAEIVVDILSARKFSLVFPEAGGLSVEARSDAHDRTYGARKAVETP
jgi:hypothetical protein